VEGVPLRMLTMLAINRSASYPSRMEALESCASDRRKIFLFRRNADSYDSLATLLRSVRQLSPHLESFLSSFVSIVSIITLC